MTGIPNLLKAHQAIVAGHTIPVDDTGQRSSRSIHDALANLLQLAGVLPAHRLKHVAIFIYLNWHGLIKVGK